MRLEEYFVTGSSSNPGVGEGASPPGAPLRILSLGSASVGSVWGCGRTLGGLPSGGFLGLLLPIDHPSRLVRLVRLLILPARLVAAEWGLARAGAVLMGRYGLYPSPEAPTLVYQLGSRASAYAEVHLIPPRGGRSPARALKAALRRWLGCDESLGAVLVIGRKP